MGPHGDITREIDEGPGGPHVGAFFDLDRTLVAGFSVFAFFSDALFRGRIGPPWRDCDSSWGSSGSPAC